MQDDEESDEEENRLAKKKQFENAANVIRRITREFDPVRGRKVGRKREKERERQANLRKS